MDIKITVRKYASGQWNTPVLPGQMFSSKEELVKAVKTIKSARKQKEKEMGADKKPLSEVEHPFAECKKRNKNKPWITDLDAYCGSVKHQIED